MLNKLNTTIAIVDSGIGGVAILNKLISKYKTGNYIYFADNLFMPYGSKSKTALKQRINEILEILKTYEVDKVIIACNTASSVVEQNLENVHTLKFDKDTTYFATNLTKKNLPNKNVIADVNLAKLIEQNIFNKPNLEKIVLKHVQKYKLNKLKNLTLACTHYELVADIFKKYCPHTKIACNSESVNDIIIPINNKDLTIHIITSKPNFDYYKTLQKLILRGEN